MNPEHGVPTHDLHVSVLEVKRIVMDSRLLFGPLTELGWGQVRDGGDAWSRGWDYASWDIDEGPG